MSIHFCFKRREDNKIMSLKEIDKAICNELNRLYFDNINFSQTLMLITMIGDLCLKLNNGKWNDDNFNNVVKELFFNDNEKKIIKKYLNDEYIYNSWRNFN